ncbi:helix-turn-helix transcriptional regulator [Angelakisella massiliensis]|uniref:helix-turn-helix transcriptional regulator n=1 Tax=Angelakisella massiliensis TaxID=1871018 RepID=UPI0030B83AB0
MEPEGAVERMEIGAKLKGARISAKLTQEQAAQALGVSRQTISNWENEVSHS